MEAGKRCDYATDHSRYGRLSEMPAARLPGASRYCTVFIELLAKKMM